MFFFKTPQLENLAVEKA